MVGLQSQMKSWRWVEVLRIGVLGVMVCVVVAVGIVEGADESAKTPASDTVGVGADTSCVNADSIRVHRTGSRDKMLMTIVIRKKNICRPFPGCIGFADFLVDCELYDTLAGIIVKYESQRTESDTLGWCSFDFLATRDGGSAVFYNAGRKDSQRLLDLLIEVVKRKDPDNDLVGLLEVDREHCDDSRVDPEGVWFR